MNQENTIDWNKQSLFTTPLGQTVQRHKTAMLLEKEDKTTEFAQYVNELNEAITNLSQSFWDIDLTLKLIKFADPKIKSFKMTKVDRGDYLKYHFENYYFRLPKLKDQALQLLNVLYRMGLGQSQDQERKVRKHEKVEHKKLFYFIDYLNEAFSDIKPIRNIIAHRGDLSDSNLTLLTTHQIFPIAKEQYERMVRMQINYAYVFENNQGALKQSIIYLLLALEEDFNNICATLSRLPNA